MPFGPLSEPEVLDGLLAASGDLLQVHDLSTLLDRILGEARRFTRAEAGSIFLVQEGGLRFSYVHNEALFQGQLGNKYLYQDWEVPVDASSLCGFAALTGQVLNIPDAYRLPPAAPYGFNASFDLAAGYRTRSVLVAPMRTSRGRVVGVLQIINARDAQGQGRAFSPRDQAYVTFFANNAALAVERALITRDLILRNVRMAELRDPKETGAHVNRVAAYAAEIYQRWAEGQGRPAEETAHKKDLLRVAALLHDVGKVAISDAILKKPGRLDEEEFAQMKRHTVCGAQLFGSPATELDAACLEIALRHHERWDGSGYPGALPELAAYEPGREKGLAGEEIPLLARVVALADVYDALISRRVYKEPWPEARVLEVISQEAGRAFDPLMVQAFLGIQDVVRSILARYPDQTPGAPGPGAPGGAWRVG